MDGQLEAVGTATFPATAGETRTAAGPARVAGLIFVAATLWAGAYLVHGRFVGRVPVELDQYEELQIGAHLARGHGFASPFDPSPGAPPTSWSPPVYPAVVAAAYRAFGVESPRAFGALILLNAALFGVTAAGVFRLGGMLFGGTVGLVAAGLFVFNPLMLKWTAFAWDHYLALAGAVWLCVAAIRVARGPATSLRVALLGLGVSALILTNASYALIVPVLIGVAASGGERADWKPGTGTRPARGPAKRWRYAVIGMGAFGVGLLSWTVRNAIYFHALLPVRGNASFEAWFGNRPGSSGWLDSAQFAGHPGHDRAERALVLGLGEQGYFGLCRERFAADVRRDPPVFAARCLSRLGYLFLSDPTAPAYQPLMPDWRWGGVVIVRVAVNAVLAALALAGAWAAWRLGFPAGWWFVVALLCGLPFVPVSVWDRQTLPMRALLLPFAAFALYAAAHRRRYGAWPEHDLLRD
jgi:hypothetical protein